MVRPLLLASCLFAVALSATGPARALEQLDGGAMRGWSLGSLSAALTPSDRGGPVANMHEKFRVGGSLLPWLEPYATLSPWVSARSLVGDRVSSAGGILVDVPLGSFVFTPSFGAGFVTKAPTDPRATMEFRSQLEVGYQFENRSRMTIGYSRITTPATTLDRGAEINNVVGFSYRMPFSALGGD